MAEPRRHDLVYLSGAAWDRLLGSREAAPHAAVLACWPARDWPAVIRRRLPSDAPAAVPIGLPLPPSSGKARLAFAVVDAEVTRWTAAPALDDVLGAAPAAWRATCEALVDLGEALGVMPRVFGSLAWTALTGLAYGGETSDLDLLWTVGDAAQSVRLVAGLLDAESRAPMRLDGEIVRADGGAVHWRELASPAGEVLVKRAGSVGLASRADFFADAARP